MLFADRESADKAVQELNGTELDGRKIFLRKVWVTVVEVPPLFLLHWSSPLPPLSLSLSLFSVGIFACYRSCICCCEESDCEGGKVIAVDDGLSCGLVWSI